MLIAAPAIILNKNPIKTCTPFLFYVSRSSILNKTFKRLLRKSYIISPLIQRTGSLCTGPPSGAPRACLHESFQASSNLPYRSGICTAVRYSQCSGLLYMTYHSPPYGFSITRAELFYSFINLLKLLSKGRVIAYN